MSDQSKAQDDQHLVELSELEQETVVGGFGLEDMFTSFFFQKTDISTFAEADTNYSSIGASSSQRTGYRFSQVTFGFTSPGFGRSRSRSSRYRMRKLFKLLRYYLDSDD